MRLVMILVQVYYSLSKMNAYNGVVCTHRYILISQTLSLVGWRFGKLGACLAIVFQILYPF